jgi:hypothetical protein
MNQNFYGGISEKSVKISFGIIMSIVIIITCIVLYLYLTCRIKSAQPGFCDRIEFPWRCDGSTAYRRNKDGDVECVSTNKKDCSVIDCNNKLLQQYNSHADNLNPATCGCEYKKANGITGYDTEGHWCKKQGEYYNNEQYAHQVDLNKCSKS